MTLIANVLYFYTIYCCVMLLRGILVRNLLYFSSEYFQQMLFYLQNRAFDSQLLIIALTAI